MSPVTTLPKQSMRASLYASAVVHCMLETPHNPITFVCDYIDQQWVRTDLPSQKGKLEIACPPPPPPRLSVRVVPISYSDTSARRRQ